LLAADFGKQRPTVLIAEPQPLIREGLAALVESGPYRVVAQCQDGEEVVQQVIEKRPAIALIEMHLAKLYTLEVVRKLRHFDLPTRIGILSNRGDRKTVIEALRCGAHAFFLKSAGSPFLFDGFSQMLAGGIYVTPQLELGKIFAPTRSSPHESADPIETLSAREHQVFSMLVEGMRAKEIAGRLEVSPKTVDTYRASLMRKLDIHDVAGLVKFAIRRNLTSMPAQVGR
jgi:DNA-binding NarL/FixJ family response regulator